MRGDNGTRAPPETESAVHPHMRGDNDGVKGAVAPVDRFTPTCVGTIYQGGNQINDRAVHPHMRGDNVVSGLLASV